MECDRRFIAALDSALLLYFNPIYYVVLSPTGADGTEVIQCAVA